MSRLLQPMPGLLLGLFIVCTPVQAQPAPCILGAFTLDLLGGAGDAPLLPATMEGKPVALYYSTRVDGLYGGDIAAYGGADTGVKTTLVVDGVSTDGYAVMKPGPLKLGDLDLGSPDMVRLPRFPNRDVGARPVIGVIGPQRFARLAVLLDLPHGVFALIRFSEAASCKAAGATFLGTGAAGFPLDGDRHALITLNGVMRSLALDPDTALNHVPSSWASPSPRDNSTALPMRSALPGSAETLFHLDGTPTDAVSDRKISEGALGLEFFERHVVLFDYPNDRVYFLPSHHRRHGTGSGQLFPHALKNVGQDAPPPLQGNWPLAPFYSRTGISTGTF